MKRILAAFGLLCLWSASASAAVCGNSSAQVLDNAAHTNNMTIKDDGSGAGNCEPLFDINTNSQLHTDLTSAIVAGTNSIGGVVPVAGSVTSSGGATPGNEIAPANTTGINLKASAGTVWAVQLGGIGSAPAYLKLYDKASAPTCGTDTPIKRLIIPAASTAANGAGSNVSFPVGVKFSLGIGYCVTTGITDADTTAPAANTFLINIDWN